MTTADIPNFTNFLALPGSPEYKQMQQLIELHEARRQFPYRDTKGKWTIGIGRNLANVGLRDTEIELMYLNDYNDCVRNLCLHVPVFKSLSVVRQAVLIDMCFNLGINGLLEFRAMLRALAREDFMAAADEMRNSLWFTQVKTRGHRLLLMMRTNQWVH